MNQQREPMHTQSLDWEGAEYILELYDFQNFSELSPVTQVQAVCFVEDTDEVVLYEKKDGSFGLPGGGVEEGESLEEALRRELYEEAAVELLDYGPILYVQGRYADTGNLKDEYHVRYWANVQLLDEEVNDPDDRSVGRVVTTQEDALEGLGWGKMAEIYFQKANELRKKKL